MPVYEYRCAKGHDYEKTEGFSAPTEQKCIVCGARAKRQISKPSVIFKGSGFYSTDNRRSTSSSDSETASLAPDATTPAASTPNNGHGHSHGDGGHSHSANPAPPAKKSDSKSDSKSD